MLTKEEIIAELALLTDEYETTNFDFGNGYAVVVQIGRFEQLEYCIELNKVDDDGAFTPMPECTEYCFMGDYEQAYDLIMDMYKYSY